MKTSTYLLLALFMALWFGLTAAQSDNATIAITKANFVAPTPEKDNLNGEWVEITNAGPNAQSLEGWTLGDAQNHVYTFQGITLQPGSSIKIHTGLGEDTATDIYWNKKTPIWNNKGDTATLKDASGQAISEFAPEEGA